jgi:tRNA-dihydrouridine synthase A
MMEWTDRHFRYFLRLLIPRVLLYTEMVVAAAIVHGDRDRFLARHPREHPVALQLGGSEPALLAEAARIAVEEYGYDEVNLNVGCPSDRVSAGRFGACLMLEPGRVAECVAAMRDAVNVPVTVKTRLGVDDRDSYPFLLDFVDTVAAAGVDTFVVHARKAWLSGLSPRQNREVPPLDYDRVYRLKADRPALTVVVNGGIETLGAVRTHLEAVDGAMIGRMAYRDPMGFAHLARSVLGGPPVPSREAAVAAFEPYLREQHALGVPLKVMTRHLFGLFAGCYGAKRWRQAMSDPALVAAHGVGILRHGLTLIDACAMDRRRDTGETASA